MPKCVNCGSSKFELWSLSGRMEDVEKDGSSLVCKECGRMQPDAVLREMVAEAKRKSSGKASTPAAQQNTEQPSKEDGQQTVQ
jgi:ribosome-binding protein aMBF1 (putative translation factor)